MFAVLAAWLLLGEAITPMQAIGGAVVLVGLALARQGDRSEKVEARPGPTPVRSRTHTPCSRANELAPLPASVKDGRVTLPRRSARRGRHPCRRRRQRPPP